jgi:hypothetical protein
MLGQEPENAWTSPEQLPSIARSRHAVELAKHNLTQALEALRAAERALQEAELTTALAHGVVDTTNRDEQSGTTVHERPSQKK